MSVQLAAATLFLQCSDQKQSKNGASAIGACIFSRLPLDLQLRVLSKLVDDLPALQSFCFASHSFAEVSGETSLLQRPSAFF